MKKLRSYHLFFEAICSKNNLLNLGNRLSMRLIILLCLILTNLYSYGIEHSSVSKHKVTKADLVAHDHTVHVKDGWLRDPYIVKSPDGNFYFTGTTQLSTRKELPEDKYSPGHVGYEVQVWKSKDLIHWKYIGTPFTLKDGIWIQLQAARYKERSEDRWRIWAPELHFINGKLTVIHTSPSPFEGANLSVAAGIKPERPWTNPLGAKVGIRHDPSLFQDDDGTTWMIWSGTSIASLNKDLTDFTSEPISIGPTGNFKNVGYEGCLIKKIGGKYVLFGTAWSTGKGRKGTYNLYYATADKITGPYSERRFAGRFLGHGTPFQDNKGRWWCTAFFNGNVPPLSRDEYKQRDLSDNAYTLNEQGLNLVPLDVTIKNNDVFIHAADPDYANPGPEEIQKF